LGTTARFSDVFPFAHATHANTIGHHRTIF